MKRRVIQLAGKTHVISLPSKWVRNFNVKKGDELEIEELGNHILIKQEKSETKIRRISFNVDNFNDKTFGYIMSSLHKGGYDEITLVYEKPKHNEAIQKLIQNLLLGFIVIEQTSKKIVLKNIATEIESEFNPALRRAFLVTISLANSSLEMLELKQYSNLQSLISLEKSNNQLTSFCLRLMNKGFYKDYNKKLFLTTIIWNIEKIGDEYKTICKKMSENKNNINKEIFKIYKEVNNYFNCYYEIIYKFSQEKANELIEKKEDIIDNIQDIKPQNKQEIQLLNSLYSITLKSYDMSSSVFGLHHEELIKLSN